MSELYNKNISDLHSNMVRFIILTYNKTSLGELAFTFQYG